MTTQSTSVRAGISQRRAAYAARRQKISNQRKATWEERIVDPIYSAPYGIRWGKTIKGSVIHIMEWNGYQDSFNTRCNRAGYTGIIPANVYLKAKKCYTCSSWMPSNQSTAFAQDWAYYTDPATGRTKRERHN